MKYRMGELTAAEFKELLPTRPVVLLPMGSHEDQGPHAPMGDYLSAERMAELIAQRATEAGTRTLVAPVVPFGGSDYFGTVPGGIALRQETLRAVLDDMLACLLRHEIKRIIVINGHYGNAWPVHFATQEVWKARRVLIPSFYVWKVACVVLPQIVGAERAEQALGHGADPLTSLAWHLFPQFMRPDLIPAPHGQMEMMGLKVNNFGTMQFEGADIDVPLELEHITPDGVLGADARLSSPETGAKLAEALAAMGARFVAYYAAHAP
ncbi:MAG: creatininase family protein [Alphaproteobacteria bacterium]